MRYSCVGMHVRGCLCVCLVLSWCLFRAWCVTGLVWPIGCLMVDTQTQVHTHTSALVSVYSYTQTQVHRHTTNKQVHIPKLGHNSAHSHRGSSVWAPSMDQPQLSHGVHTQLSTHSHTLLSPSGVRLTVCDQSGRSLQVYLGLSHTPYPHGLLPGNTLLLSMFQRKVSR